MLSHSIFWRSVRMSWLRRRSALNQHGRGCTSRKLEITSSTQWTLIRKAWSPQTAGWQILSGRTYTLLFSNEEITFSLYIPINGEPDLMRNHRGVQHKWSTGLMLYQILDDRGNIRDLKDIIITVRSLKMECDAMVKAVWKKVDHLKTFSNDNFIKLLLGIKPRIGLYNVYGQIVFKKATGCAHFYKILNTTNRDDGWSIACNSFEKESLEYLPNKYFCNATFHEDIKDIIKLNYFNTLKQFMIRHFRNNLFLNNRSHK